MKKIIVLSTLVMFSYVIGFAQDKTLQFGLSFSPNVSWFKSNDKGAESNGARLGYNFGPIISINFSENFSVETGLFVYNNGGKIKYTDAVPFFFSEDTVYSLAPGATYTYKSQYLELPLSLKLKTNEIGYMTYFLKFGINPQMLLRAKGSISQHNIEDENFSDELSFFNLGYNISGGFEYSLGASTILLVEAGFMNGIFDATKDKVKGLQTKEKDYNIIMNNLLLRVGLLF